MMKIVMLLALCLAVAFAAPQVLLQQTASQLGLPYANGWTDGPNNGLGPVVSVVPHLGYSGLGLGHGLVVV